MKINLEYDEDTGEIKDIKGQVVYSTGMKGFEPEKQAPPVLELIKQNVTTDEIIKLKNNGLL